MQSEAVQSNANEYEMENDTYSAVADTQDRKPDSMVKASVIFCQDVSPGVSATL